MRTTQQIEKETESSKVNIKKLQTEKERAAKAAEEIKTVRQGVALAAFSSDDPTARRKLEKARADQIQAQLKLEDLDSAISEAHQKLNALRGEREQVFIQEKKVEFADLGKTAVEQSQKIDDALLAFVGQLLAEHGQVLERLHRIAAQLGYKRNFNFDLFRRCFYGRMHKSFPHEFQCHSDYRVNFSYAERLGRIIENTTKHSNQPESMEDEHGEDFNPATELVTAVEN